MKATNIIWDVDYEEDLKSLPTEVEIPDGMTDEEEISDYLTDLTGFCHCGFSLPTDPPDNKRRFSLSDRQEANAPDFPTIVLPLPDGSRLRAVAYAGDDYPAINIYWDRDATGIDGPICFAEYNPERSPCYEVCIGAYQSDQEDTTYYKPYMAERESDEEH